MKNKHFLPVLFLTCIALLYSCTSAPKHLAKAIAKDKPYVAGETRKIFPCIVTASDTINTVDTVYDLIEAKCPDTDYITPSGDTVKLPGKTTYLPGKTIYRDRIIKEQVEDQTLLNNLEVKDGIISGKNSIISNKENLITKLQADKEEIKNKRDKWRKWCFITWALLALGIAGKVLLKSYKPF